MSGDDSCFLVVTGSVASESYFLNLYFLRYQKNFLRIKGPIKGTQGFFCTSFTVRELLDFGEGYLLSGHLFRWLVQCSCVVLGINVGCLEPKNYHPPPSRYGAIGHSVEEGNLTWMKYYMSGLRGNGMTEMDAVFGVRRGIGWRFMGATSFSIHFLNDGTQTSKGKAILIWARRWWMRERIFTGL